MLSKNAELVLNTLKEDKEGFIPTNIHIEGLDILDQFEAIKELFNNNLIKIRNCESPAIELNN